MQAVAVTDNDRRLHWLFWLERGPIRRKGDVPLDAARRLVWGSARHARGRLLLLQWLTHISCARRGFYIRDLLEYAGVDLNSIASIDFFTKDHSNGAYRSFTKKALFDSPRYYFPYLAANEETGTLYSADGGDDLWVGAQQVEASLHWRITRNGSGRHRL